MNVTKLHKCLETSHVVLVNKESNVVMNVGKIQVSTHEVKLIEGSIRLSAAWRDDLQCDEEGAQSLVKCWLHSILPSSMLLFSPTAKHAGFVEHHYFLRTMFDVLKIAFISSIVNFLGTFFTHQVWE